MLDNEISRFRYTSSGVVVNEHNSSPKLQLNRSNSQPFFVPDSSAKVKYIQHLSNSLKSVKSSLTNQTYLENNVSDKLNKSWFNMSEKKFRDQFSSKKEPSGK